MPLRPVPAPSGRDGDQPDCPLGICEGNGWVLQEDGTAAPCACRERRIGKAMSRGMGTGIPKIFRGVSFDRKPICDMDPWIVSPIRRFTESIGENVENGRGLWFYGDVGTGKTSLAMLIAGRALDEGWSVAVYSVPRLLTELRASYDADSRESFFSLFKRLTTVDLLVLDDLGSERQTEWVLEQLYSIVNERWQDQRSVIVTSNIPKAETPVGALRKQIAELQKRSDQHSSARELADVVGRLENVVRQLTALDSKPDGDPFETIRGQVGDRTVSRLSEMCEPLPVMGTDLRRTSAG
jgi:DNA replication protein DnaC